MRKTNRKGFTVVELVIVIAIVAVLAAVLIPTFASIIKKANDSAYLQDRTNQQLEDLAEKFDNLNYLSWEDFEAKLAEKLAALELPEGLGKDEVQVEIKNAITAALAEYAGSLNTGLTEEQVKKIVEKAMEGMLTTAQIEAIIKEAIEDLPATETLTEAQVKQIVDAAIKNLQSSVGNVGITKQQMLDAIAAAMSGLNIPNAETINALIEEALKAFGNEQLTPEELKAIIDELIGNAIATPVIEVVIEPGQDPKDALINAIKNAPDGSTLKLPANTSLQMKQGGLYWLGQALNQAGGTAKHITIDLNGSTLDSSGSNAKFVKDDAGNWVTYVENGRTYYRMNILEVPVNGELILKNGNINIEHGNSGSLASFIANTGSTLNLIDMVVNTDCAGILPAGDASEVVVENSTINANNFALSTNRAESNQIRIIVKNSELSVTNATAMMINTAADAHVYNSTITGVVHAIALRAGALEIKDSVLVTTDTDPKHFSCNNFAAKYGFAGWWQSGNTFPAGTIVVGDYAKANGDGSYSYSGDAIVTMTNVAITSADNSVIPEILLAASDPNKTVSVTYDANTSVDSVVVYGSNWVGTDDNVGVSFCHPGKIVVNGTTTENAMYYSIPTSAGTFTSGEYSVSVLDFNDPSVITYDYEDQVRAVIESKIGFAFTDTEWATVRFGLSSATVNQIKFIYYTKDGDTEETTIDRSGSRISLSTEVPGIETHVSMLNSGSVASLKKEANYLKALKAYCASMGITVTDSSKFVIGDTANVIVDIK